MADFTTPAEVDARIASALQTHTYTQDEIDAIKTAAFMGGAVLSTVFNTSLGSQFWRATETGTYTNGLTVNLADGITDMVYDGTTWRKSVTPIDLSGYATDQEVVTTVNSIYTPEDQDKVHGIITKSLMANIAVHDPVNYVPVLMSEDSTLFPPNIRFHAAPVSTAGARFFNFALSTPWVANHKYFVAMEVTVTTHDAGVGGLFNPVVQPKYNDPTAVGTGSVKSTVPLGSTGLVKVEITTNATIAQPTANKLFVQFAVISIGQAVDITFTKMYVADLGVIGGADSLTYAQADALFGVYGFTENLNSIISPVRDPTAGPSEQYTPEEKEKLASIVTVDIWNSIATHTPANYAQVSMSKDSTMFPPGIRFHAISVATAGNRYFNFSLDTPWLAHHKYFVAMEVTVTTHTAGVDGNFFPTVQPKYNDPTVVGTGSVKNSVVAGNSGVIKVEITTNPTIALPTANKLFVQFANMAVGTSTDVTFTNILVVDLGEIGVEGSMTYTQGSDLFDLYGFREKLVAINNPVIGMPSDGGGEVTVYDLEGWGDSLMAQNWMNYIPDRNVFVHGFGGKKSYYIRDQYLAGVNLTRSQVICIGRNNYNETTFVLEDIEAMVKALGHRRFLIMMIPNGGYTSEIATGGSSYSRFGNIATKLSGRYPHNFVDSRKAMIEAYDFGAVKLTASYVQPAIGSNVQITVGVAHQGTPNEVAGTTFLSTENSYDVATFPTQANRIAIGTIEASDEYEVISVDSETLMTVKLLTNGSGTAPGGTVANPIDESNTKYLKVMQKLDLYCYQQDTIQSTLRIDGIHMSNAGLRLLAKVVGRAVDSIGI